MVKKRKKVTRHRGTHTHGRGFKKKARGSGHRGGVGKSGTGKRADQRKTWVTKNFGNKYFGTDKALRRGSKSVTESISLKTIENGISALEKKGLVKREKDFVEVNLKKYKIIGKDSVKLKMKIHAKAASEGALESVKKSGGEILLPAKH